MSSTSSNPTVDCVSNTGCPAVSLLIEPRDTDLGGFSVRRALPTRQCRSVGPWVFFDHMGPAEFEPGQGVNVRPHPHVNLATVTYVFEGEIFHRDSLGNALAITPGAINLMVAGSGIVHSERERPEIKAQPHKLNGLQLWMALPEAYEEIPPEFIHYPAAEIPSVHIGGVPVRVLIGEAYGTQSPVKTFAETLYVEAALTKGERLALPKAEERAVYVVRGEISIGDTTIGEHGFAVIAQGAVVDAVATNDTQLAIIGGESLGKRFMEWNFVSSRKERIEQAKSDWAEGRFETVPGDDQERIELPSS